MFKKKGSSTNVAIVCSLICAGFGVYYGLNANKSETVASDAFSASVVDSAEAVGEAPAAVYHTPDGPALNPTPAKKGGKSVVVSSDGKPVAARDLKTGQPARVPGRAAGTAFFARGLGPDGPVRTGSSFARPGGGSVAGFARPMVDPAAPSASATGTTTTATAVDF